MIVLRLKRPTIFKIKINKDLVSTPSNMDIINLWRLTSSEVNFCIWLTRNSWVFEEGAKDKIIKKLEGLHEGRV